jgi:hypothetical protein
MTNIDLNAEIAMSYDEYVAYLLKKYGSAKCDYFYNKMCVSKNMNVERTNEGLFCHHIDEHNKTGSLSDPLNAQKHPFDYQKAERLVYCNYLEHLLLHIKIAIDDLKFSEHDWTGVDIQGAMRIWRELNGMYKADKAPLLKQHAYSMVKSRYDDYIFIMRRLRTLVNNSELSRYCSEEDLARDTNGAIVNKLYNDIVN